MAMFGAPYEFDPRELQRTETTPEQQQDINRSLNVPMGDVIPPEANWQLGALAAHNYYRPPQQNAFTNTMLVDKPTKRERFMRERPFLDTEEAPDLGPYKAREQPAWAEDRSAKNRPADLGAADAAFDFVRPHGGQDVVTEALWSIPVLRAGKLASMTPKVMGTLLSMTGDADAAGRKVPKAIPGLLNQRARIGHNRPPPFEEYSLSYPKPAPPVRAFDEVKGKEYDAKALSPETEAFMKERARISADMKKNGYTPYFDPTQRYHADPTYYPPNADTLNAIPTRQETAEMRNAQIDTPEGRERLRAGFERGRQMPNTENWYAMGQLEQEFIKEYGPAKGRKEFEKMFAVPMATTTGGANPTANYLMAAYGNYLRHKGEEVPENSHQIPSPIGGRFLMTNMDFDANVAGDFDKLGILNPKRHNFTQNFTGNQGVATIDEQMTGALTPGLTSPPKGTYGMYERIVREEAAKAGMTPQEYQGIAWSGLKNIKTPNYTQGKPMIEHINDSIERTHRLTGMPREEIVRRGIMKGEIPMYAVGGLLGAGGLKAASDQMGGTADQTTY